MQADARCMNCKFFRDTGIAGQCFRHPPTAMPDEKPGQFPTVGLFWVCGEFAKAEAIAKDRAHD